MQTKYEKGTEPPAHGGAASTGAATALRRWRSTTADAYDADMCRDLEDALIASSSTAARWRGARSAAAAVGAVMRMAPAGFLDPKLDLAMTALVICAARGNAAACIVASNVIRRVPGAGHAEARVGTSWLVRAFRKALSDASIQEASS